MSRERFERYLELRESGHLEAQARKALSISAAAMREYRLSDPDFAAREDEIEQVQIDTLEREAFKRAVEGEPTFDKEGNLLGQRKSDTLLMFLLKGNRRGKYGDKTEVKQDSALTVEIRDLAAEHCITTEAAKRLALSAALATDISVGEF